MEKPLNRTAFHEVPHRPYKGTKGIQAQQRDLFDDHDVVSKQSLSAESYLSKVENAGHPQPHYSALLPNPIATLSLRQTGMYRMTPRTRSTVKSSPGRSTRNSIFGRPPLPPAKLRNSSTDKSPVRTAAAHDTEVKDNIASDGRGTEGTPWLACRDAYGVTTTVAMSETGEGIHVRWHYPQDKCELSEDEDEDVEVEMIVDEERGVTPTTSGPSHAVCHPFPRTPMAHPYDAGSVIRTPVKKARQLQRSPPRIGDKGIRCLYEQGGVLRELNGGARIVLSHPVGSTANLSREQVECLEREREERIIQVQVQKLLADKQRIEEQEKHFSDIGDEDEVDMDVCLLHRGLRREGTNETSLVSQSELDDTLPLVSLEETNKVSDLFRGPNGELLDHHGHQMLGREGTILIDSTHAFPKRITREDAFVGSTVNVDHLNPSHCASKSKGPGQARFGPEGTELID